MTRTAFISVSLKNRPALAEQVAVIRQILGEYDIAAQVFVDQFAFSDDEEQAMMAQARAAIDACDLLIAEMSHKAIGVGVEVGYAVGRGKPVIYIRGEGSDPSTTIGGMAMHRIVYRSSADLATALSRVLRDM